MKSLLLPSGSPAEAQVDVLEMTRTLWEHRKIISLISLGTLLLAACYAFLIAKPIYKSTALLIPTQAPSLDQLGGAAALLGKKGGASADVELYQSLLTSRTVIRKLLLAPIQNHADTAKGRTEPVFQVMAIDTNNKALTQDAMAKLASSIDVNAKETGEGGILEVTISSEAPWLSQQIGNSVLEIGQEQIRTIRIERSSTILARLKIAAHEAQTEWDSSTSRLTWYKARNRSAMLPEQLLEISRLDMERLTKEQKYLMARREFESQQLERAKAAPPMLILDSADLPARKSKPKRVLILALGLAAGFFCGCVGVLVWSTLFVREQEIDSRVGVNS